MGAIAEVERKLRGRRASSFAEAGFDDGVVGDDLSGGFKSPLICRGGFGVEEELEGLLSDCDR